MGVWVVGELIELAEELWDVWVDGRGGELGDVVWLGHGDGENRKWKLLTEEIRRGIDSVDNYPGDIGRRSVALTNGMWVRILQGSSLFMSFPQHESSHLVRYTPYPRIEKSASDEESTSSESSEGCLEMKRRVRGEHPKG